MSSAELCSTLEDRVNQYHQRISSLVEGSNNEVDMRCFYEPNKELSEACLNYCYSYGLARQIGANVGRGIVNPHVVRAAIPVAINRLEELNAEISSGKGMETPVPIFAKVLDCIGLLDIAWPCHVAIHNGLMVGTMGPVGLRWGPKYFCPAYHQLEMVVQDLDELLKNRKDLCARLGSTEYAATWRQAFEAASTFCRSALGEPSPSGNQ